jgi:hypothetical protein
MLIESETRPEWLRPGGHPLVQHVYGDSSLRSE